MIAWLEKHLIPEARDWWRLWSARLLAAAIFVESMGLLGLAGALPARMFPPHVLDAVVLMLTAAALLARFVKQRKVVPRDSAK